MDDRPAIEYHPFGTITLNFDDGPIKLRRCRLGDLRFAKDSLEEIRAEKADARQAWVEEVTTLRDVLVAAAEGKPSTAKQTEALRTKLTRINELAALLEQERIDIIYRWLAPVVVRMGDGTPPERDDWPLEIFDPNTPNEVLEHWQTRPLASGRLLPNPTTTANGASSSVPQPLEVDFPPAPLPQ